MMSHNQSGQFGRFGFLAAVMSLTMSCNLDKTVNQPSDTPKQAADSVTIYRDNWGVPHVYAKKEEDVFYGLGYAQASDRLESMMGGVYLYQGRLAELQGESRLATDIELRRWRHVAEAATGVDRLEPQVLKNYQQFVAGVNQFAQDNPDKKPAWAQPYTVADQVGINRAIFWLGYATTEGPAECRSAADLQTSLVDHSAQAPEGASNGWVVSPDRTANHATILLADPHVELHSPVYYEYRLHAGSLDSAGYALGPLLWQAHNSHVSWAMTTGNPDLWDCYEVEVDPQQHTRFLFDGKWQNMELVEETFEVRGGESVTKTFEYTRHNGVLSPVVARKGNKAYVVSISQMHDTGVLDNEVHQMNQAGDIFELQQAMQSLGMFPQNIIAGDSSGNIWYLRAGKTPIRPEGFDFTRPVPGNDSSTAWQGYYPLENMLQMLNPPQGFIQNNNVAPDAMFSNDNLDASDYASGLFHDTPGRITTRGIRGIDVLSATDQLTIEDAKKLAFDERWITAQPWVAALNDALQKHPEWIEEQDEETANMADRLSDFDGVATADSVAALNFYYWHKGMGEVLQTPGFEALQSLPWDPQDFSPAFRAAVLQQTENAAAQMVEQFGTTEIAMGKVFRIGRGEKSWPLGGETIDAAPMLACLADFSPLCDSTQRAFKSGPADEQHQRRAYRGSQAMRVVELSSPIRSWSLRVYGQSDDPASPHFDDQAALMSRREFKPVYFGREELDGHIESTLVLQIEDHHE